MVQPMPQPPNVWQVYRQQYLRPSSKATKALWIIFPVGLIIAVIFVHSVIFSIVAGAVAVLLLTVAIVFTVKQRRKQSAQPKIHRS